MFGVCKLCRLPKELCNSHAIPDSYFRVLFQKNSGKAILLSTDDDDIDYDSDSMATPQLCDSCEKLLNEQYEKYSINLFRNAYRNVSKEKEGIFFDDVDLEKIIKFILAIYWRACVSDHQRYGGAVMHEKLLYENGETQLRECMLNDSKFPGSFFSVKVQRLFDSTGCWSLGSLKDQIIIPYRSPYGKAKKVSVNFVLERFLFSVVTPALSKKEKSLDLVLYPAGKQFLEKYRDFLSVPELRRLIDSVDKKIKEGRSRLDK